MCVLVSSAVCVCVCVCVRVPLMSISAVCASMVFNFAAEEYFSARYSISAVYVSLHGHQVMSPSTYSTLHQTQRH